MNKVVACNAKLIVEFSDFFELILFSTQCRIHKGQMVQLPQTPAAGPRPSVQKYCNEENKFLLSKYSS